MDRFFLLVLSLSLLVTADQCYYPNGLVPLDYTYQPCAGTVYSSCCIPSEGDVCLSNGLCYFPKEGYPYRGACTDKSWSSDACPKYCVGTHPSSWQILTSCGGGQYCCSETRDGTCCTDSSKLFSVEPGVVINAFGQTGISVPGTATATSSSSTSSSSSSTSTATSTSSPAPSSKNNSKAIAIGASVGGVIFIAVAALLAFFLYRHFSEKNPTGAPMQQTQHQVPYSPSPPQLQPYSPLHQEQQLQQQNPYATYPPYQQAMYSPIPSPGTPHQPQQGVDKPPGVTEVKNPPELPSELDVGK